MVKQKYNQTNIIWCVRETEFWVQLKSLFFAMYRKWWWFWWYRLCWSVFHTFSNHFYGSDNPTIWYSNVLINCLICTFWFYMFCQDVGLSPLAVKLGRNISFHSFELLRNWTKVFSRFTVKWILKQTEYAALVCETARSLKLKSFLILLQSLMNTH